MNALNRDQRPAAMLAMAASVFVAVLMPAGAQAQWYSSVSSPPPLYPYAVAPDRPAVTEAAPRSRTIRRRSRIDPALIEELRHRPRVDRPRVTEVKGKRVIRAEAEITIIGPDRMSIRLFRANGSKASAATE
jgi:hypothetical protein